jgi:hypothetical protein
MRTLDLTENEKLALVEHLRRVIENDPYPLPPWLHTLQAILAKLNPPEPRPEPLPPLKAGMAPSVGRGRRRR